MRKSLRQSIRDYHMPLYMQEILTNNYCSNFLRMTIVNDDSSYMFYYETGMYRKLAYANLSIRDRLELLETIMTIEYENEEWLIKSENYLIEPELVYSLNNNVDKERIKILFYPDFRRLDFTHKICNFADKLLGNGNDAEQNILKQFKNAMLANNRYKARQVLEKNIDHYNFEMRAEVV